MGNSTDKVFTITCDCCQSKIHVDPRTQSIYYSEKANVKKRSFEEIVGHVTTAGERAQKKYDDHMKKEQGKEQRLDDLFQKAKKKAEKNPDQRPPSIFDYD